jgi:glycosyltransferase involved in cell wall biosynthesis
MTKTVRILGTHGVPANYGGFETAAENVARFLVGRGWRVVVYCQVPGTGAITTDTWNGIERVMIPVATEGWRGTSKFDLLSIKHAAKHQDLCLTFGYNTAIFNTWQRIKRIPNVVNMDGIEWSRSRWGFSRQAILYVNERIACFVGNHLIADHPVIETYLRTRARDSKITTITYGADPIASAPTEPVTSRGLEPGRYLTLICRPIPENSILELVQGFSRQHRGFQLAMIGDYKPDEDDYHRAVVEAASDEVAFIGSVYDKPVVEALRFHGVGYLHGHTVGGTNPSLVEAMAAGNPVVAHNNPYNRWVTDERQLYFSNADEAGDRIDALLGSAELRTELSAASLKRYESEFTWEHVAGEYEKLLLRFLPVDKRNRRASAADVTTAIEEND